MCLFLSSCSVTTDNRKHNYAGNILEITKTILLSIYHRHYNVIDASRATKLLAVFFGVTMESAAQTLTSSFNIGFCSDVANHILLKEVEKGSNYVFSPLSLQSMLSLIAVGSKGFTLEQLLSFLGSKSVSELNSLALQIVTSVLLPANECQDVTHGPIVSFTNGAWVDQRFD